MKYFKYILFIIVILFSNKIIAQLSDTTLGGFSPFKVGAAVSAGLLKNNSSYRSLVAREYSSLTPENAMKFGVIHPQQNTYYWTDADTIVAFAQQYGKRIHGHTLIWHNNVPDWLTNFVGDSAAWENIMKTHIQTVVSHYKGIVTSWDVVNEAIADDGTMRSTIWLQHLGSNYIARAFQYAHDADTSALLFYNDYNHESSSNSFAKLYAIQNLVQGLIANGVPINGVGMQMHINKNTNNANIQLALDSMYNTGLLIHISELDVAVNPENNQSLTFNTTVASLQFSKFKFISRAARNISANKFYGITTWDVTDADSWIPTNYSRPDFPLPFNRSYQKKTSYQGLKDGMTTSWNAAASGGQSFAGTYTDLGTNGTAITTNFSGSAMTYDNDVSSVQNIGFNFVFNGTTYSQFVLNTNGYIKLGASPTSSNSVFYPTYNGNTGSVTTTSDIDLIYPYNHDLTAGSGTPEYRVYVSGTAGSRVCTIQFKNLADKLAPTQYTNIEFQIKLYEGSNIIDFVYGTWMASSNSAMSVTAAVGIKGATVKESVNVAKGSTVAWTKSLSTSNNIFFRDGDYPLTGPQFNSRKDYLPDVGRTFRFTASSGTASTDYFRSQTSGNWSNAGTWQSSSDVGTTWINATTAPSSNAAAITIQNGHTVTIAANTTVSGTANIANGGNLIIAPNTLLTINNGGAFSFNNQPVIIQSTAAGTGAIIGNTSSGGGITGASSVTVQRYLSSSLNWRVIGFPFTSTTTLSANTLSGFYNSRYAAYTYNESEDDGQYANSNTNAGWTSFNTGTTTANKGILLVGNPSTTINFTGNLNSGNVTIPLSYSSSNTNKGWNLVANPYPSNINWTNIYANNSNIDNAIYRVNPNTSAYVAYVNGTSSDGSLTNVIENGASFFVHSNGATAINMQESYKTASAAGAVLFGITNPSQGKIVTNGINESATAEDKSIIRLTLKKDKEGYGDAVVLRWGGGNDASDGFDNKYDAYDLGRINGADLSVIDSSGVKYSIFHGSELKGSDTENRIVKLKINQISEGSYTIASEILSGIAGGNTASLYDAYQGTYTELGSGYTFNVNSDVASQSSNRFSIVFNPKEKTLSSIPNSEVSLLNNPSPGNGFTLYSKNAYNKLQWQLLDNAGRNIQSGVLTNVQKNAAYQINTQSVLTGLYFIKLVADDNRLSSLKLVKQ